MPAWAATTVVTTNFYIMGYLDKVIQFYTFTDYGRTHCCPVNSGICADFNFVLHNNITNLANFLVSAIALWCKTKTITTNNCAGVDNYFPADPAIKINFYTSKKRYVISQDNVIQPDNNLGKYGSYYQFLHLGRCRQKRQRIHPRPVALLDG